MVELDEDGNAQLEVSCTRHVLLVAGLQKRKEELFLERKRQPIASLSLVHEQLQALPEALNMAPKGHVHQLLAFFFLKRIVSAQM